MLFQGCGNPNPPTPDDTPENTPDKIKTISATDITSSSALLTGEVNVEIVNYKSVAFGMLISEKESDMLSYNGNQLTDSKLVGNSYSITASSLTSEKKYYYRAYLVLNSMQYLYGDIKSFTTLKDQGSTGGDIDIHKGTENGHEWIDLGLSVKWATCNVGATKPEDYGRYYAWGETSQKSSYDCDSYRYSLDSYCMKYTKYNTKREKGTVDNKVTLDLTDDAARVNWEGSWRMPTRREMEEPQTNCTWTWTTMNNVHGYLVTSKKSGYTNCSIFLPAAGFRSNGNYLYDDEDGGFYWSSTLSTTNETDYPYLLQCGKRGVFVDYGITRVDGLTIRAVCR